MPKIIWTDNFQRSGETPGYDERVVMQSDDQELLDRTLCILLNPERTPVDGSDWYLIVPDDYVLQEFKP